MRLLERVRRRQKSDRLLVPCVIDALEHRRMFSGETLQTPIAPILANTANPSSNSITLNQHFFDSLLPGTLVTFTTTEGNIQVGLTDAATPQTVANFLNYVNSGEYNGTIIHRTADLNLAGGPGGTPENPATIVQGGGYNISNGSLNAIPTGAPVADEFRSELYGDVEGTIAMAKTSTADSATSEWYFNASDNTELDTPTTDSNGVETSYTVFGKVLSGFSAVQQIAALPTDNIDPNSGLTAVPVIGLTEAQISAGASVTGNNLVFVESVTSQPGTTYKVTSDNKSLVTPIVTDGVLSFAYGTGSGTATITVNATNLDGTSTSTTFAVTVPNSATPNAGPVASPVTAPDVVTGKTGTFNVLANDTDSIAPLNPATVTIVTQPGHGTASVNSSDGSITYSPTSSYVGSDSLTYTVTDLEGNVSAPATVTLNSVPPPAVVSIGGAAGTSLTWTQPDGVTGHISVLRCKTVITFTTYQVTTKLVGKVLTVTGPGATITNITTLRGPDEVGSLRATSNGPISLGSVNADALSGFVAPTGTLTGTSNFGEIFDLDVAAALDANITIDTGPSLTLAITIPNVTNTNLTALGITSIHSKQWLNTDGGTYNLSSGFVSGLFVPGTFAENLSLSGKGYDIFSAQVGTPTGVWALSGSLFKAVLGTPGPNWSLTTQGLASWLVFTGNLSNSITAAAITKLSVSGATSGATIQTDATFSKKFQQIGHMTFTGPVTNSVIFSAGNIGSISAASLTDSRIYAGVNISVAQNGALASSLSDLSSNASIGSITLGKAATAFSNSLITADIITSMKLGNINTSNGGNVEGVSAHVINGITATLVPGGILRPNKAQLKTAAALLAYEKAKGLNLGDFEINLF